MKKIYFLFLLALLPLVASAETVEINGIYYNLISKAKQAEVTKNPNGYNITGKLIIPSSITYKGVKYSVTKIADVNVAGYWNGVFANCSGITNVSLPKSITRIGQYAFAGCSSLTDFVIPNGVKEIGPAAFMNCSITSVSIPSSVITIEEQAFRDCSRLTSVHITDLEAWCKISFIGTPFCGTLGDRFTAYHLYLNGEDIKDLVIPNSVTSIGSNAFYGCIGLISVTIPNSVTTIGSNAFWSCSSLKSVSIPNSVTSIGKYAFYECSGLTSVTIPNSVAYINDHAFSGCSSLKSVTIPSSVTSIDSYAFYNCSGLKSVTIPNSVAYINDYAFSNCSSLKSVTIPIMMVIEEDEGPIGYVGSYAFSGCSNLTTITLGKGIEDIDQYAFSKCANLTDVYCYAENAWASKDAFSESYIEYATLHVPVGSVDAYKAAEPWSKFKSIVKIAAKVKLDKSETIIEKGKTVTLNATVTPSTLLDKSVTWKSSNKKVATVTEDGEVKGIKAGTATITCTSKMSGTKATCKVTIIDGNVSLDKTEVTLEKGSTVTLKATVLPETLEDKSVTWTSSDKKVATVTTKGKVKGVKAGTATITCTSNATGLSATCKVTVINGTVTLNKTVAYLEKGKTTTLKATLTPTTLEDMSVTWKSSDKSIATVTSKGKVKGVGYGTATITCTSNATGVSATCQVTVGKVVINIPEFTLRRTRTATLAATLYPTTLTDKGVTWKSSDTKVATVTSSGKVKGVGAGTATITCTSVATGLKGTCTVTVLAVSESRSIEGDDDDATGIDEVNVESVDVQPYDVYDLNGRKVAHQVTTLEGLPNGLYIVNGKKIIIK